MNKPLCNHIIATRKLPAINAYLKEYILAGNGVFVRAVRPEFQALIPITEIAIPGLPDLASNVELSYPKVPSYILLELWQHSVLAQNDNRHPIEALFYIKWVDRQWQLIIPEQQADAISCQPVDTDASSLYATSCIEVHSHHSFKAKFSSADDAAEQQFRIYAVLGEIFSSCPKIRVRVGIYGHYCPISAEQIFSLPSFIKDEYVQF